MSQFVSSSSPSSSEASSGAAVSLLGCGWLGLALAHALMERGLHVRGSTTRSSRLGLLSSVGIEPFLLRIEPEMRGESTGVGSFFSSRCLVLDLPPEISLGTDYHTSQLESIFDFIREAPVRPEQLVYVSSTSVYGADQGLVDETIVPRPDGDSGEVLVRAEHMVAAFARSMGLGLTIVRPGGLIGPGRHPGLFLAGRRELRNGEAVVNMIHQLDLADQMAELIAGHPVAAGACEIYNAVSSHHPTREEFYVRAARAIGVEPPTFAATDIEVPPKIVRSEKIVRVTKRMFRYDDLYSAIGAT